MSLTTKFFSSPTLVFTTSILLRLTLLLYGRWQDTHSPVKYTDIDYLVFTDAARFVSQGLSPYQRATYRYTPLLAWILLPTTWGGLWFDFGKVLFAAGDVVTGWLVLLILKQRGMKVERGLRFAGIWLLNPMVANISTRGSSEGLVVMVVVALLWAVVARRFVLAGVLLGLGVHVKIYPFIYALSIFWYLDGRVIGSHGGWAVGRDDVDLTRKLKAFLNRPRVVVTVVSFSVTLFTMAIPLKYGMEGVQHAYLYHTGRLDHRHNFSIYNTALHLSSVNGVESGPFAVERLAFLPQLLLSALVLPLLLAKKDLPSTMLAQTFAFVTFNKVCTSQYFLWYLVFLPFYLPNSSLLRRPRLGITALVLWAAGQGLWLQQGYQLEFLGRSAFYPGLWLAGIAFFAINCWILGLIVSDIQSSSTQHHVADSEKVR